MQKALLLAGDIGGTKTQLGLFRRGAARPVRVALSTFASVSAQGLEELVERFLGHHPAPVAAACFGIAGPVLDGRCATTNLPWKVTEAGLRDRFGWPSVRLVNDLAATAMGVPLLRSSELAALDRRRPRRCHNQVVIAPGTGLGIGLLIAEGDRRVAVATEGGHVDFGPNSTLEAELWQYLQQRLGHVSVERVASGMGIANIYRFLVDSGRFAEHEALARQVSDGDPAAAIATSAMAEDPDPLCVATMELFLAILGAVAGNLALTLLPFGGLFLGGGIPPKILPLLRRGTFRRAFVNKGRFRDLVDRFPVRVILNQHTALLGAAQHALEMAEATRESSREPAG